MRRMLWVALLAAPAVLASSAPVQAQGCAGGGCGGAAPYFGGRPGFTTPPFGNPWGFAFRMFPGLHQHGPLVNYGPYEGYYPFEPYGPWTSDLRYTGPTGPARPFGVGTGWAPGLSGLFHRGYARRGVDGCGSGCGQYALSTLRNVAARLNPFHRFGCGTSCKSGCN